MSNIVINEKTYQPEMKMSDGTARPMSVVDDEFEWKYEEDIFLTDLATHLKNTYGEHYVLGDDKLQTIDVIFELGLGKGFCKGNAIKYLMREGKKDDDAQARKDLLKVIHYCMWLYNGFCEERS